MLYFIHLTPLDVYVSQNIAKKIQKKALFRESIIVLILKLVKFYR